MMFLRSRGPAAAWSFLNGLLAMSLSSKDIAMICVFGRPGAGKTTVAEKAISKLQEDVPSIRPLGLDLDICVPRWMKDNFAVGIYPTLAERLAFAKDACDFIEDTLEQEILDRGEQQQELIAVVSFSFVNSDLRDYYRERFPQTQWILIDTSESEAGLRIKQRKGHFYKGKETKDAFDETKKFSEKIKRDRIRKENSDWDFAPVEFEHVVLDGKQSVDYNANEIVQLVKQSVRSLE